MLGIIGAMDQEVSILKEKMEVKKMRCRQGQCCCLHTDSCRLLSGRSGDQYRCGWQPESGD